jgi:N-methylhydantoinase A/oxoprolinase/acetone carboxylase beta subunit
MGDMGGKLFLGIDIGGTFTDFVALDPDSGSRFLGKTLTTPKDPCIGVTEGLKDLLSRIRKPTKIVNAVIHATTLATNLIVERKGAKVGLITTKGFRDVLEMRTESRYDLYDLFIRFPPPLCPRYLRIGVNERLNYKGEIVVPLDVEEVRLAVSQLKAKGIECLAICFLHSYADPVHELRAQEASSEVAPEIPITISYRIQPEIREYGRVSTTVANAYILPKMKDYLTRLKEQLRKIGCDGDLYIMLSSGGITTPEQASAVPIMLCESGPAAGAAAAQYFGGITGLSDILSFDMGGTTAKVCIITDGVPTMKTEFEAARIHRFRRGSGVLINTPVVDLIDIGAGGGSIAKVGVTGLIDVGPESAGADPGPVCYGLGGSEPTVTDANLILGYLNPDYFLGGEMKLEPTAARHAIQDKIAGPLGLSIVESAWGIHEITNENMAIAARMHILENGYDPRTFTLMAFGGAGPIQCCGSCFCIWTACFADVHGFFEELYG